MSKRIFLNLDLDWASEDVIEHGLSLFDEFALPLSIFQTHLSKAVLSRATRFKTELEWHPNFMVGSSQGKTFEEISSFLSEIPAEKKVTRCHLYYEPEDFVSFLSKNGIEATSDDLSPLKHKAVYEKDGHAEVPLFFEDGGYIKAGHPLDASYVVEAMEGEGDYAFLFHPIHLAFNSIGYSLTRGLKDGLSREKYGKISTEFILSHREQGYGVASLAKGLIRSFISSGYEFCLMKEALM